MEDCLARLQTDGILLKSDTRLPSVATLVAKEPVHGSWWAHPASHAIFQAVQWLSGHPDVLVVKLAGGKDTFVHRRLWPELLAVATSHEPWQFAALSAEAGQLYRRVVDRDVQATGATARLLEVRLLVRAEQFHGATGNHQKRLESWMRWAERARLEDRDLPSIMEAKRSFQAICPGAKWPWPDR